MLLSPITEPNWTSVNEEELASFLTTDTGKKLLEVLAWRAPRYGGDIGKRVVESGLREGYEDALVEILELKSPGVTRLNQPKMLLSNFPPLDDDSAWQDFEKQVGETKTTE